VLGLKFGDLMFGSPTYILTFLWRASPPARVEVCEGFFLGYKQGRDLVTWRVFVGFKQLQTTR
jgi:hypothetical protein